MTTTESCACGHGRFLHGDLNGDSACRECRCWRWHQKPDPNGDLCCNGEGCSRCTSIDVTECPDCGHTGRYDRRVLVNGRGIYTCPNNHQWQDADETPDGKGYIAVTPPTPDAEEATEA